MQIAGALFAICKGMDIDQAVSLAERMPARVASVTVEDGKVLIKFWPDMTGTGKTLGIPGAYDGISDADLALSGKEVLPDPEPDEEQS